MNPWQLFVDGVKRAGATFPTAHRGMRWVNVNLRRGQTAELRNAATGESHKRIMGTWVEIKTAAEPAAEPVDLSDKYWNL